MLTRELLDAYRAKSGHRSRREDGRHAAWWADRMGAEPIAVLTTERILQELDHLAGYGRSPSTVAFYLRYLRRVTAWAALVGYVPSDPCGGMALPKEDTPDLRVLTEEEEAKLCLALGPPYALWVKFAIETGLKQSEQFTLRWRDVDLERSILFLPHRTGAMTALSLSPATVMILQQLRHVQVPSLWVFPDPKNPSRPMNIHAFYVGRWVTAVHHADIPRVAWKDLRHTCGVRRAGPDVLAGDVTRYLRQRETRQAYVYRAIREGRLRPLKRPATIPAPFLTEHGQDVELRAVMERDLTVHPMTFGEAARLYAVHHLRDRPARRDFDSLYRRFWTSWQERPLQSLTRKEIRVWYGELGHIPGRANKALTFLRSLYN